MKKIIYAISTALLLTSCVDGPKQVQNEKGTTYMMQVNYIGNGVSGVPTSDTIVTTSYRFQPYLVIKEGIPCIVTDSWTMPVASYVRSFKILSIN